jgi:hypothetical protein
LNQLVDFNEIQQGDHGTEGDLDATILITPNQPFKKWWTLQLPKWMQHFHQSTCDH